MSCKPGPPKLVTKGNANVTGPAASLIGRHFLIDPWAACHKVPMKEVDLLHCSTGPLQKTTDPETLGSFRPGERGRKPPSRAPSRCRRAWQLSQPNRTHGIKAWWAFPNRPATSLTPCKAEAARATKKRAAAQVRILNMGYETKNNYPHTHLFLHLSTSRQALVKSRASLHAMQGCCAARAKRLNEPVWTCADLHVVAKSKSMQGSQVWSTSKVRTAPLTRPSVPSGISPELTGKLEG